MRITYPETLRVPPQGSSTEGKSGPKARLKSVVDGQRVNNPVPLKNRNWGTEKVKTSQGMEVLVQLNEVLRLGENQLS